MMEPEDSDWVSFDLLGRQSRQIQKSSGLTTEKSSGLTTEKSSGLTNEKAFPNKSEQLLKKITGSPRGAEPT